MMGPNLAMSSSAGLGGQRLDVGGVPQHREPDHLARGRGRGCARRVRSTDRGRDSLDDALDDEGPHKLGDIGMVESRTHELNDARTAHRVVPYLDKERHDAVPDELGVALGDAR